MTQQANHTLDRRTALSLSAAALCSLAAPALLGQAPTPPTTAADTLAPTSKPLLSAPTKPIDFDVASFKLNKSNPPKTWITIPPGGDGFAMQNRPFHDLIRFAFAKGLGAAYRMSGQPPWVDTDLYDVQAKVAPEDIAEWQQLNPGGQKIAIQEFIVQYLKLKYHPDSTPHAFYALVVGKNGPKGMTLYKPGDTIKTPDGQIINSTPSGLLQWVAGSEVMGLKCNMERLAAQLSGHADKGVLDQTGLIGPFNFDLRFEDMPDASGNFVRPFLSLAPADATPIIFSSIKQLGLELKPTTGSMDGMVIDHIERPPED